jgi:tetratricopeptide (TPR) repeat protein
VAVIGFRNATAVSIAVPAPDRPAISTELPPPRLVSRDAQLPIRLDTVTITTSVVGRMAHTAVELGFFNPNARVLEGELQFPLARGQEITGMAMDFNGTLREAVPVEKGRGQAVFEDITRVRVDPALAEKTVGNNFKLRVYPIPANGRKVVVLRYEEPLTVRKGEMVYRLPLDYGERVGRLDWNAHFSSASAPRLLRGPLEGVEFRAGSGGFDAAVARTGVRLSGTVEVAVGMKGNAPALTQQFDGATWFYAEPEVTGGLAPRAAPSRVAIAWDASGSGAARDHVREFALLGAYFKRFSSVEVALTVFRDAAEPVQVFKVSGGDWSALRRALENSVYDGASDFSVLSRLKGADELLLFSDGIANYGETALPRPAMRTYAIGAAAKADADYLRAVAERSGGRYIDATGPSVDAIAAALVSDPPRVRIESAKGVADVLLASPYAEDGRVMVAGRLAEEAGSLVLRVEQAGAAVRRVTVPLRHGGGPAAGFAAQRWARLKVAMLEADYDLHRAEVERLGKRFRLITRATSLIILDTAADYARHDIEPPAELRAEYERLRAAGVRQIEADRQAHLERVAAQFGEKQAWWAREFPKGPRPAPVQNQAASGAVRMQRADAQDMARQEREARPAAAPGPLMQMAPPSPALAKAAAPSTPPMSTPMSMNESAAKMAGAAGANPAAIGIRLAPWQPDAPYARRMRDAEAKDLYRIYLDERESYRDSTAFFLDVADMLLAKGQRALALRVLSNLAEMNLENRHILRVLGYRLLQAGDATAAVPVFRRVRELSPNEPQSHRDLGLALAATGEAQKAVDALYEVVSRPWHGRFPGVELVALAELNAIVATARRKPDTSRIDPRLIDNLPLDLRAVLTWDADNTDIDLWVTDPNGEKAFYGNQRTWQGGRMSADFTGGYGPEEFSLRIAKPGKYRIEANFYGQRQQIVTGATTLQVRLTTHFGTAGAKEQLVTLRLKGGRDIVMVGEFEVGGD